MNALPFGKSVSREASSVCSKRLLLLLHSSIPSSLRMSLDIGSYEDISHHKESTMVYFQSIVEKSLDFELFFSKIGAVLNVFHLIVLTRKQMMTSSINVIMIGIALCDFFLMLNVIRGSMSHVEPIGSECSPPPSLFEKRFDWFLVSAHVGFRQCSAWLAVLISLIMYLIITDITNQNSRFSKLVYGFKTVSLSFLICVICAVFYFFHHEFVLTGTWRPETTCDGYDQNREEPIYEMKCIELFEAHDGMLARIRLVIEGVVVKLISCLLLPTSTCLLIYELKRTQQKFGNAGISNARKEARKSQQYRTTILVIFISFTFLLSELPIGFAEICEAIYHDDPVAEKITKTVGFMCDAIFTANSSIHCLIYFSFSLQYRKTVFKLLKLQCWKKRSTQVTTVQSVTKLSNSQNK